MNPFFALRLFESASTVRASFSLGAGNLNVSHISLQDGFLVEHQLRFCIIPSICLKKSRGRGSTAYPPSSKRVSVGGSSYESLAGPAHRAVKHLYQGVRRGIDHERKRQSCPLDAWQEKCTCGLVDAPLSIVGWSLEAALSFLWCHCTMVLMVRIIFLISTRTWSGNGVVIQNMGLQDDVRGSANESLVKTIRVTQVPRCPSPGRRWQ